MAKGAKNRRGQNAPATQRRTGGRTGRSSDGTASSSSFNEQNGHAGTNTNNSDSTKQNGNMNRQPSASTLQRLERDQIVLYKKPIITLYYAVRELICKLWEFLVSIAGHRTLVGFSMVLLILSYYGSTAPGPHQNQIQRIEKTVLWCAYWIGLGVLSSIGLGTGLHTFIIYLGPHIARVTLAAFECHSLDFPEPPYPEDVTCPTDPTSGGEVTLWAIMNKVRLECLMWGAGTALGELPPYFMARAARLSGQEPEDEDYAEYIAHIESQRTGGPSQLSVIDRLKLWVEKSVLKVGFFGILACASIPNPLFDLAGIVCGHSLISFWRFFGATLIGKAIVKAHLQMVFVIIAFSEHHMDHLINKLKLVPAVGPKLQVIFREFLNEQKRKLHRSPDEEYKEPGTSLLQHLISLVVFGMIVMFVVSIINSLAQAYHKRVCRPQVDANKRRQ